MPHQKILLILDLDETLIHATRKPIQNQLADFQIFSYYVYIRPHLQDFFKIIQPHFELAIWSSASDSYVKAIIQKIVPSSIDLKFVWGRSKCTYRRTSLYTPYAESHYHYIKRLGKLKRQGYQLEKMLIVDDSPHKCVDNYGNAIYPQEFLGDSEDRELVLLAKYLLSLKDVEDMRKIEKRGWQNNQIL